MLIDLRMEAFLDWIHKSVLVFTFYVLSGLFKYILSKSENKKVFVNTDVPMLTLNALKHVCTNKENAQSPKKHQGLRIAAAE